MRYNNLLSLFQSFRAAFSIENPEALSQYGLDDPVCTISVTAQGQEEIRLVLTLDSEDFPTFTLALYRHNGTTCLATVDGTPTAYVTRTQTVDLIEAIHQIILDG